MESYKKPGVWYRNRTSKPTKLISASIYINKLKFSLVQVKIKFLNIYLF